MTAPSRPNAFRTRRPQRSRMNPRKVIILMTIAVLIVMTVLATLFFHGIPPWPVLACFAFSHGIFCWIVSKVKPYEGPHNEPMTDPAPEDWPSL